jgi:hypothetical protein
MHTEYVPHEPIRGVIGVSNRSCLIGQWLADSSLSSQLSLFREYIWMDERVYLMAHVARRFQTAELSSSCYVLPTPYLQNHRIASYHTVAGQTTQVNNATDRVLHVCLMHQKHLDRTALRLGSLVSIHLFPNRLSSTASL